ncbi:MAG: hypothetical protein JRM82_03190, partial [Nitrososphaerota archaeon]|nr:hypothetical protein [Nitrososphaerota archaeon]
MLTLTRLVLAGLIGGTDEAGRGCAIGALVVASIAADEAR